MKISFVTIISLLCAQSVFAILDENDNGFSDLWEMQYNGGEILSEELDPEADPDGDGWTNAKEAVAGSNPFSGIPGEGYVQPVSTYIHAEWSEPDEFEQSYLINPGYLELSWTTLPGKKYTLLYSETLELQSWLPVDEPFTASGGLVTYGLQIDNAEKCFWRVAIEDIDADSDNLTNYEESFLGTNPEASDTDQDTLSDFAEASGGTNPNQADADGDGMTDPFEIAAGTDSNNQDTDGDGIPDPIDAQPLVNAQLFADADEDGIADANDTNPANPRGPAPRFTPENTSGNPLSNLIKDETVKFVFTVSNPAGAAPTVSNLSFYLNGTEEPANIAAIGNPIESSQRFVLTWEAKTTSNYPALTLQNLTVRFQDAAQATAWLNLARIDVAEWEGKIIALPYVNSDETWSYDVLTHMNGIKNKTQFVYKNGGSNNVYRGPKAMSLVHPNGSVAVVQLANHTIPFLKISNSQAGVPVLVEQQDYATLATGMDVNYDFNNGSARSLQFELSEADINTTLSPGQTHFDSVSLQGTTLPLSTSAIIRYLDGSNWQPFYSSTWGVASTAAANSRILRSINIFTTSTGQLKLHGVNNFMDRDVKITSHASGTLDYPGLPQGSVTSPYGLNSIAVGTAEWRKVSFKIYPPEQHFTYSRGYCLKIRAGMTGDANPQSGWTVQTKSGSTFSPLTIPADGIIEILTTDTNLYPQLISSSGLELFFKRGTTVNEPHVLSLDILPIVETNSAVRMGQLNIIPVDTAVDANRDGDIAFDGTDKTSVSEPYRFWINDDMDRGNTVDGDDWEEDDLLFDPLAMIGATKDCDDEQLLFRRDLEDLTRLWIDFSSIEHLFPYGDEFMELKVRIEASSGNPVVNFYLPVETDGGREYLKNEDVGYNQLQGIYGIRLCQVGGSSINVPTRAWEGLPSDKVMHLLFEGVKEGEGKIIFEIWDDGIKICDLPSVDLVLKKAQDMYETWSVGDVAAGGVDFTTWPATTATQTTGQSLPLPTTPEERDYIMFVHGWNMPPWEKETFSSTMFKRMWHQGYKGRFGTFRWPTFHGLALDADNWTNIHAAHFDGSEHRAWNSAAPLASLTASLANTFKDDSGNSLVRIYAHSMGNVVTSEALRQMTAGSKVHTYISAQAALSSHVWDNTTEDMDFFQPTTPNVYGYYWQTNATTEPHFWEAEERPSYMSPDYMPASTIYINHYNPLDWALSYWRWQLNQSMKPDSFYYYSRPPYDLVNMQQRFWTDKGGTANYPTAEFVFPDDRFQIFSFAAESRAYATGQQGDTGGKFDTNQSVNLNESPYNFGGKHKGHSGQFRSTIQKRWTYWAKALRDMRTQTPSTP